MRHSGTPDDNKAFAAYLTTANANEIADLRLGKNTDQLYAEAEKLHKQLDRHAYGPPTVRFEDDDIDQADIVACAFSIFSGGRAARTLASRRVAGISTLASTRSCSPATSSGLSSGDSMRRGY